MLQGWPIAGHSSAHNLEFDSHGAVAQLGERCVRNAEVEGSNPFRSTFSRLPLPGGGEAREREDSRRWLGNDRAQPSIADDSRLDLLNKDAFGSIKDRLERSVWASRKLQRPEVREAK